MQKIVLATSNPHKVEEINEITKGEGIEFILPPGGFNPIEDGNTFEENALIKAVAANKMTNMPALADDSGLCVDALDGAPGLHSARYAGTQQEKIQKLLFELKNVPLKKRTAKFVCAMVLVDEKGKVLYSVRGECKGKIGFEQKGKNGFGYDPVFIVNGGDLTMAELSEKEKNKLSHRGLAIQKITKLINNSKKSYGANLLNL